MGTGSRVGKEGTGSERSALHGPMRRNAGLKAGGLFVLFLVGGAAVGGLVAFTRSFTVFGKGIEGDLAFQSRPWRERRAWTTPEFPGAQTVRAGMGADLRDRVLRPGLSRRAVLDLLGPPDDEDWRRSRTWSYGLGTILGGTFDPSALRITFEANGHLLRAEIEEG